jgi:intein/homing endonuclease
VAFAVARGDAALWWATGAGKTLGAIVWAVSEPRPVVVLTNGSARRQFAGEVTRWTTREPFVVRPLSSRRKSDETLTQYLLRSSNPFVILGWESLHDRDTYAVLYHLVAGASLILDESHSVKDHKRWEAPTVEINPKTGKERTIWVRRQTVASLASWLCPRAARRLETTATPIPNRVKDLWAQLDCLEPGSVGRYWDWARKFCGAYEGKYGMLDEGATNLDVLRTYVGQRAHIVGPSIALEGVPAMHRKTTTIPASELTGIDAEARAALRKAAKERGAGRDSAILEAKLMATAARKNPVVARRVVEALHRGEKVLVFTGRRRDVGSIHARIQEAVGEAFPLWAADGETPSDAREDIRLAYMAHVGAACIVGTGDAWGECVPPDTLLVGENKPIVDHEVGDETYGVSGKTAIKASKTRQHKGRLFTIKGMGLLPFRATENHPVLVVEGRKGTTREDHGHVILDGAPKWVPTEELVPWEPALSKPANAHGHFLLIPRLFAAYACDTTSNPLTFDLERFVKNDNARKGRRARGLPTEIKLHDGWAWVMGLFVAEGSASANGPDKHALTFSINAKDDYTITKLRGILRAAGFVTSLRPVENNCQRVVVKSSPLALLFGELFGRGASNKRIPDEVLRHGAKTITMAFLSGYVAGDGYAKNNIVRTSTASRTLALQLQLLHARCGRLASINEITTKDTEFRGRVIQGGRPHYLVTWRHKTRGHNRHQIVNVDGTSYLAVPLQFVKPEAYSGPVVDIETVDHTFLASNVVVHNSLNLHDSDRLFITLLPWTWGQLIQWEGRIHRIGQLRECTVEYVVAEGTIEEQILAIILDKLPGVMALTPDAALDDVRDTLRGGSSNDVIANLLDMIAATGDAIEDEWSEYLD